LLTGECKSEPGRPVSLGVRSCQFTGRTLRPQDSVPLPVET
jgi:hypothetical protein